MLEYLLQRPPAQLVITADLALRDPLDEHLASDLRPQLHVCAHPSPVRSPDPPRKPQGDPTGQPGPSGAVVFDDHKPITGAVVFDERLHSNPRLRNSSLAVLAASVSERKMLVTGCKIVV